MQFWCVNFGNGVVGDSPTPRTRCEIDRDNAQRALNQAIGILSPNQITEMQNQINAQFNACNKMLEEEQKQRDKDSKYKWQRYLRWNHLPMDFPWFMTSNKAYTDPPEWFQ